jgi:sulfotransferase famil protein
MLLSLTHKFLFVANLKSASTAIEAALADFAEVRLRSTRFGKHNTLTAISRKFAWVKRHVPYEDFFVFAVVRDPVDFLLSLYNAHHEEDLPGGGRSTAKMSFDDFLDDWCRTNWQAKPQHRRFVDEEGRFRLSHAIPFDALADEFPRVCAHLGLPDVALEARNVSPQALDRGALTPAQVARIAERYADDYRFLRERPRLW